MRVRTVEGPARLALGYAVAAAASAVAVYLSFLLDRPLDGHPFPILLSAVMLSAWFGGLGPGMLATAVGILVVDYYFEVPLYSLAINSWGTLIRLLVFVAAALLISSLSAQLRAAERAAAAGRAAAEQLAGLITASEDAIVGATLDGVVLSWNPGAERLLGHLAADVVGRPVSLLVAPGAETELPRVLDQLRRGDRFGHYETAWIARDGRRVDVSVRVSPVVDADGRVGGGVIVARDLGPRRERAEIVDRLAAIVSASEDAIIGKTLEGLVTSWNAAAERLYGYSAAEMVGHSVERIVPEDRRDELASVLERLRRGEQVSHLRTVRLRRDGGRIDVVLTAMPIRSALGEVVGAAAITHEVGRLDEGAVAAARELVRTLAERGEAGLALSRLLEGARSALRADTATALRWDEAVGALVPIASSPPAAGEASVARRGEGVVGRAVEAQTTVIENDYGRDGGAIPAARLAGVRAAMASPIRSGERVAGAIAVGRRAADQPFAAADAYVLETLADIASVALEDRASPP
ncbi:MAG TPA: PAS domain S-box protein [Chloroflexota bacterium]|jgi:PAS domain S-box-containing protein